MNSLYKVSIFLVPVLLLGCATAEMQLVQKNIEQGKLVSAHTVSGVDFLNQYRHPLESPVQQMLDLNIALERKAVMVNGDRIVVQLGLSTRKAELKALDLHLLVYNPVELSSQNQDKLKKTLNAILSYQKLLPPGSRISLDSLNALPGYSQTPLIKKPSAKSLEGFVKQFVRLPQKGKHHYVLLVSDIDHLSQQEKQNTVDLSHVLRAKSATLSVLSLEDKPSMAFIKKLAQHGGGLLNLMTKGFKADQWLKQEIYAVNSSKLKNIKLTLNAQYGAQISRILSPRTWYETANEYVHQIDQLELGEQYVLLAELKTPMFDSNTYNELLRVQVEFFDPENRLYHQFEKSAKVNFSKDRNVLLGSKNSLVERSLLILDTQKVIEEAEPLIHQKRYYKAIAVLTQQEIKLARYIATNKDLQLQRDAGILKAYTEQLYNFSEKSFQGFRIWKDLSWDKSRLTDHYL